MTSVFAPPLQATQPWWCGSCSKRQHATQAPPQPGVSVVRFTPITTGDCKVNGAMPCASGTPPTMLRGPGEKLPRVPLHITPARPPDGPPWVFSQVPGLASDGQALFDPDATVKM